MITSHDSKAPDNGMCPTMVAHRHVEEVLKFYDETCLFGVHFCSSRVFGFGVGEVGGVGVSVGGLPVQKNQIHVMFCLQVLKQVNVTHV